MRKQWQRDLHMYIPIYILKGKKLLYYTYIGVCRSNIKCRFNHSDIYIYNIRKKEIDK